jgi:hypothetical protein
MGTGSLRSEHGNAAADAHERRRPLSTRSFPVVRLFLYYAALVLAGSALIAFVPGFREALIAPIAASPPVGELATGLHPVQSNPTAPWQGLGGRGALTLVAMVWAFAMALPVAWALMQTRRLRYDPSLVHTILVLPIVVAGVVLVVKNSLALAFALAGIVAGVRFRQKLEAPEEAVYVLLALGVGLAAGVQALDIALVMSMLFTVVVMTLWRYDVGRIYAGGRGGTLAIGNARLLTPQDVHSEIVQARSALVADGIQPDGMLLVRSTNEHAARQSIEIVLGTLANEWRFTDSVVDDQGQVHFEVLVNLKSDADPAELIADLEARAPGKFTAARYVPFGGRRNGRST